MGRNYRKEDNRYFIFYSKKTRSIVQSSQCVFYNEEKLLERLDQAISDIISNTENTANDSNRNVFLANALAGE